MNHKEIRNLVLGLIVGASGLTALAAFSEFQAGTPIKAADVNAKFNDLDTRVAGKQARVTGTCAAGSSISAIAADSTVTCEADDVGTGGSSFSTGAGLNLLSGVLSVSDGGVTRAKLSVTGTVADGKVLKAQGADLVWADDAVGANYTAGAGLALTGAQFSVKLPFSGTIGAADAGSIGLNVVSSDPSKTAIKGLGGNYGVVGDTLSPTGVGVLAANSGVAGGAALEVAGGIKVSGSNKPAFVHTASATNIVSNSTCIDNVLTNGKPNAIVMVTQLFSATEVYNNSSVGVFYRTASTFATKWCIFNQITAGVPSTPMPVNATFNVLVFNQ